MGARHIFRALSCRFLLPLCVLFLSSVPQQAHAASETAWEVDPFLGFHAGGGFDDNAAGVDLDVDEGAAFGLVIGAPDTADTRYELFYGFLRTRLSAGGTFGGEPLFDLDIHYLHAGGSYRFAEGRIRPFVSGGLGGTHFSPRGDGPASKKYFSLSLGAGVLVPVSGRIAIRFEGRGFLTFLPESADVFCVSSGGVECRVNARGNVFGGGRTRVEGNKIVIRMQSAGVHPTCLTPNPDKVKGNKSPNVEVAQGSHGKKVAYNRDMVEMFKWLDSHGFTGDIKLAENFLERFEISLESFWSYLDRSRGEFRKAA